MRCETSFFSLTLYKKHLTRYWPLWAVWLVGWFLALPVRLWNEGPWSGPEGGDYLLLIQELDQFLPIGSAALAVAAPIVAVAVFFHLFKTSAANFAGALPLRREGLFATALAAGYTMLMGPLMIISLITFLVECLFRAPVPGPLFSWLGGCFLLSFFWLSFSVLCCVISGSAVAAVCFYTIFNGVVPVMAWLIQNVLNNFLYGFDSFSDGVWDGIFWMFPLYKTTAGEEVYGPGGLGEMSQFEMLWIYAGVGFLMLLAALGLHHIRKAERAGELITFGAVRWVYRLSATLCGGLSFGLLFMTLIFGSRGELSAGPPLAVCCGAAAAMSWLVAHMLLEKTARVLKRHWRGAALGALCFVLAISAIDMDWIGFTRRVPRPEQVKRVEARFYGGTVDPVANAGLVYDGEAVRDIVALHQYLVDHRYEGGGTYVRVELDYDLGLTTLRRTYSTTRKDSDEADPLWTAALREGSPAFHTDWGIPNQGNYQGPKSKGTSLVAGKELEALWNAVKEDVEQGRYRSDGLGAEESQLEVIQFGWIKGDGRTVWQIFYVRPATTSTQKVLQELELPSAAELYPETAQTEEFALMER